MDVAVSSTEQAFGWLRCLSLCLLLLSTPCLAQPEAPINLANQRVKSDQVAFEVNLDSVARRGVRIHPSVLQLSRHRAEQP